MKHQNPAKHIMLLTGEPSGDFHAGHLVSEIKQRLPNVILSGIGGKHLKQLKVDVFYDIDHLSAMGITEVLTQFRFIKKAFDTFKQRLRNNKPDLLIIIDYPGFNLKAAEYAKTRYNIPVLYFIAPKVWAWKKGRLKKIKNYVDHTALIFPFEEKIYKTAKITSTYVGNPLADIYHSTFIPKAKSLQANENQKTCISIGLLPGSRKTEINRLLNILVETASLISRQVANVNFLVSKAPSIKRDTIQKHLKNFSGRNTIQIHEGDVKDILTQSDLVIAASGTVTLEAALCCVPTIIVYKMSVVSFAIGKILVSVKYAGLANIIANAEIMPEFLQHEATPQKISEKAVYMLNRLKYYHKKLKIIRNLLGKKNAAKKTAGIAITMLNRSSK